MSSVTLESFSDSFSGSVIYFFMVMEHRNNIFSVKSSNEVGGVWFCFAFLAIVIHYFCLNMWPDFNSSPLFLAGIWKRFFFVAPLLTVEGRKRMWKWLFLSQGKFIQVCPFCWASLICSNSQVPRKAELFFKLMERPIMCVQCMVRHLNASSYLSPCSIKVLSSFHWLQKSLQMLFRTGGFAVCHLWGEGAWWESLWNSSSLPVSSTSTSAARKRPINCGIWCLRWGGSMLWHCSGCLCWGNPALEEWWSLLASSLGTEMLVLSWNTAQNV